MIFRRHRPAPPLLRAGLLHSRISAKAATSASSGDIVVVEGCSPALPPYFHCEVPKPQPTSFGLLAVIHVVGLRRASDFAKLFWPVFIGQLPTKVPVRLLGICSSKSANIIAKYRVFDALDSIVIQPFLVFFGFVGGVVTSHSYWLEWYDGRCRFKDNIVRTSRGHNPVNSLLCDCAAIRLFNILLAQPALPGDSPKPILMPFFVMEGRFMVLPAVRS